MLAYLVQFGNAHLKPSPGNPVVPLVALVGAVCVGAVLLALLGRLAFPAHGPFVARREASAPRGSKCRAACPGADE